MNNPICNTVFDSRDLIEYKEHLESELVELYNEFVETHNETAEEDGELEEAGDIEDVDFDNEEFAELNEDEIKEYEAIRDFCEELENSSGDFLYGEAIIHEDNFTDYAKELCEDCGYISKDFPSWIEIDWEATAENVKQDYSGVEFEGEIYYIR